ncbi:MAG: hypothetical protein PUP92_12850 [Rhizonema sp. PD38]|nr:hypothetical protein [Rhizonema sp. PD38]
MIQLDQNSYTHAGRIYQLNDGYREFGRIVTVEAFAIYCVLVCSKEYKKTQALPQW